MVGMTGWGTSDEECISREFSEGPLADSPMGSLRRYTLGMHFSNPLKRHNVCSHLCQFSFSQGWIVVALYPVV